MPIDTKSLISIINHNKDKKLVAKKIIETNPKMITVASKLTTDRETNVSINNRDNKLDINRNALLAIHEKIKTTRNNNKNIIQLFPDIELSIQILVSSILSPKKMTDVQLNYRLDKKFSHSSGVLTNIIERIKEYINTEYELEDKLPEILRESLFLSGAYPIAVIPEASVDDVINTDILTNYSTEEYKARVDHFIKEITKPINLVKEEKKPININEREPVTPEMFVECLAQESIAITTDNINILRFNDVKNKIRTKLVSKALRQNTSLANESIEKLEYLDIFRSQTTSIQNRNIEFIKTKQEASRRSLGKPMIVKLPTECVIPLFIPGDETSHIGYLILLDEESKPLNVELTSDNINSMNTIVNQTNQSNGMSLTQKAYKALVANTNVDVDINQLFNMYKDVLERQIYSSIKNSLYTSNADIANKNDIYFLMFTRALNKQKTSILYIPKSLLTYFTFYYNELGIGKSLLDNLAVLTSLRAILLFSKVMAQAKQAIDVTNVDITLDPNDPDPEKTIEQIQASVYKLRENFFPVGLSDPAQLVTWIQRAGLKFGYNNNPNIPNVKIEFSNDNIQHSVPNTDQDEELRKQSILALGLSPEVVDNGFSPEFATTIVNNNVLMSKRIAVYGKTFGAHLTQYVQTILYNDTDIRNRIRTTIIEELDGIATTLSQEDKDLLTRDKSSFIESYIDRFTDALKIELPKPDNTNLTNLSVEYELYKEKLDDVLESVLSDKVLTSDVAGELNGAADSLRELYKHHLLRNWMVNNNYYPEVLDFAKLPEPGQSNEISKLIQEHLIATIRNATNLLSSLKDFKDAANSDLNKITDGEGASGFESSSSSSSDSDSNSDDSSEGDSEGGDMFDLGDGEDDGMAF